MRDICERENIALNQEVLQPRAHFHPAAPDGLCASSL